MTDLTDLTDTRTETRSRTRSEADAGAFTAATGRSLEDTSGAHQRRYRAWQLEQIAPHVGDSLLEVGAGLGEFASQFHGRDRVAGAPRLRRHVVTDVDPGAVAAMADRFADHPEVEARVLDLTAGALPAAELGEPVSAVVAVNVLEHIEDDCGALRDLAAMVRPGGRVVLWVPAYEQLYGEFDRAVGHVRRYTPRTMNRAIVGAGLRPAAVRPINFLGGLAWWLTVRRGGVGAPDPRLVRFYDRLVVPTTRALERRVVPPFGQSVLGIAVVPG